MRGLGFSTSGKHLALHHHRDGDVNEIHIYDTATWKLEKSIPWKEAIRSLSFSPDGKTLAMLTNSGTVLWDWRREDKVYEWPAQSGNGRHEIAFFPDGSRLAIGGPAVLELTKRSPFAVNLNEVIQPP